MLDAYLDREVAVHFLGQPPSPVPLENGILRECSHAGLILEQDGEIHVFIPMTSVRKVEIKPKPSFWKRLTGSG